MSNPSARKGSLKGSSGVLVRGDYVCPQLAPQICPKRSRKPQFATDWQSVILFEKKNDDRPCRAIPRFDHAGWTIPSANAATVGVVCGPRHRVILSDCFSGRCVQTLSPARRFASSPVSFPCLLRMSSIVLIPSLEFVMTRLSEDLRADRGGQKGARQVEQRARSAARLGSVKSDSCETLLWAGRFDP